MRLTDRAFAAVAVALAGCAGAARALPPPIEVPDDAARSGWAEARIAEGVPEVFRALSERGAAGMRALRLRPVEVSELFTDAGRQRIERSVPGLTPSPRERRWQLLAQRRSRPVLGWCARGVRVAEPGGVEGFRARTLFVERVLIVGAEESGRWAAWVEGLVLTSAGWRMLPWVTFEDAVEAPRRDHTDLGIWDCDLARRSW